MASVVSGYERDSRAAVASRAANLHELRRRSTREAPSFAAVIADFVKARHSDTPDVDVGDLD